MKKDLINQVSFDDHVGCFGDFSMGDLICRKFCVLRISCAIEHEKNKRLEVLEDLVSVDGMLMKIQ
jgi:hypothetical protein